MRRVSLPGANELFRPTQPVSSGPAPGGPAPSGPAPGDTGGGAAPEPAHTGRVRHDEKITVYVSSAELVALEQARLQLRAEHGLAADRGRIVRAAIARALADLAENGEHSDLVARLRER